MSARILVVDDSPTIRRVVASILDAHGFRPLLALDGIDALERLAKTEVDLILLDFVMPRMNGYQFCRELRAIEKLKATPVVLMSAKGDKIRDQFVRQTGAVDAITKPFDPRGLVAVVERALERHRDGGDRPVPEAGTMPEEETVSRDSAQPHRTSSSDGIPKVAQAALRFGAALRDIMLPAWRDQPGAPKDAERVLGNLIQRTITADSIASLVGLIKSLGEIEAGAEREVLSGDIAVISIAEILQLLHLQRQSGRLVVYGRNAEITLHVRDGDVDLAEARRVAEEFLVGRYLVEDGVITRQALEDLIARPNRSLRLGELLVDEGLVTPSAVRGALVRQTSELVYEVARWKLGRFSFLVGVEDPAATKARLGLATSALVMEGFRRVDEWRLIEGTFDFDEVLHKDATVIATMAAESELTDKEKAVLAAIDGEHTVREIVDDIEGSSFELCRILYQFVNSRLVRRSAA